MKRSPKGGLSHFRRDVHMVSTVIKVKPARRPAGCPCAVKFGDDVGRARPRLRLGTA